MDNDSETESDISCPPENSHPVDNAYTHQYGDLVSENAQPAAHMQRSFDDGCLESILFLSELDMEDVDWVRVSFFSYYC